MTTAANPIAPPIALQSLLQGAFGAGTGPGCELIDPSTGAVVATASSAGLDLAGALAFARDTGGPALRAMTYGARAAMLGRIADVLLAAKERWYEIARRNSGNTAADAAIDVDGAIGTLKYYAKLGAAFGDATMLRDGTAARLARDPEFQGLHIGVPLEGVAIHINAYNFPSWGLWEKAAVGLLAGVPVLAKPATATAWLPAEMVRAVDEAAILPRGALSLLCGSAGDLLDHVGPGDAIAFTGSAATGETIRRHPRVVATGARVNIEADSLNAAILGPGIAPESPVFGLFVREVVREMTVKAGQKCTAIRRAIVPEAVADAAGAAIAELLRAVVAGDPATAGVTMGPVVSTAQRDAIAAGRAQLAQTTHVIYEVPADGLFIGPVLLRADGDAAAVHEVEIFGPVATVVPYADADAAFALARRGGGSLVASVFSDDPSFLADAAQRLATSHGRVMLVDASVGDSHSGHGIVLPSLLHGGPGRAGGGAELGAFRGLGFYHHWSAIQGAGSVLATIAAKAVDPRAC